jgi:oligoendopeptidase F
MQKRSYNLSGWRLDELIEDTGKAGISAALKALDAKVSAIESVRPSLRPEIPEDEFANAVSLLEDYTQHAIRIQAAAALRFSADTQDQEALALLGQVEQALTEAGNRIMFLSLWWRGLDDGNARRLLPAAGDARYSLHQQRLFREHTLTEPEEKVISIKDVNGPGALTTIYDIITNKFMFTLEVDGEKKELNRDALAAYVRHPSADIREEAYKEQFRVFSAEATVLGQIYVNRVRDWKNENIDLRRFPSPIAVRNLSNDVPDHVVDTLLSVCEEESGVFHRYFRMKAQGLGMQRLRRFDLYAPVSGEEQENIPFDKAAEMVLESLGAFSEEMRTHAERVFSDGHLDSEPRNGKRGGAFCYSVSPELTPWVLVNYTGEPRQVATLAHELGHAVHSLMASGHSILTFHSALPMAETASVFSEMLLTDRLLSEVSAPGARRAILLETVDNIYATVMRQAFFVLFERKAHEAVVNGSTIDGLSELYMENLRGQFGETVEVDDIFRHEWTSIPHIYHTPFYCYAYSFGMLLSLSLYSRYRDEGAGFAPVLLRILELGGSAAPAEILAEAGVDMTDPSFWKGGFRAIEDMVYRLEKELQH